MTATRKEDVTRYSFCGVFCQCMLCVLSQKHLRHQSVTLATHIDAKAIKVISADFVLKSMHPWDNVHNSLSTLVIV